MLTTWNTKFKKTAHAYFERPYFGGKITGTAVTMALVKTKNLHIVEWNKYLNDYTVLKML